MSVEAIERMGPKFAEMSVFREKLLDRDNLTEDEQENIKKQLEEVVGRKYIITVQEATNHVQPIPQKDEDVVMDVFIAGSPAFYEPMAMSTLVISPDGRITISDGALLYDKAPGDTSPIPEEHLSDNAIFIMETLDVPLKLLSASHKEGRSLKDLSLFKARELLGEKERAKFILKDELENHEVHLETHAKEKPKGPGG
jgi:hypothetical protein